MGKAERLYNPDFVEGPKMTKQQLREMAEEVRASLRQDAEKLLPSFMARLKAQEGLSPEAKRIRVK